MSKAHDPHWRYIALRLEAKGPLDRKQVGRALSGMAKQAGINCNLTRFAWPHAIVRVPHHQLTLARAALPRLREAGGAPVAVTTLSSSGTIRTLTQRLGILQERRKGVPGPPR